jgi:hypothetical protein
MAGNVFDFRSGKSIKGLNPQEVGENLERIRAKNDGTLTPDLVLSEVEKDKSHPLRDAFEWDDTKAAHQHRLLQARKLIVSVRVLNTSNGPTTAFVSVRTPDKGRNYVPTIEALSDDDLRERLLSDARQMVESLERRYAHLKGMGDLLDRLKKAVG